MSKQVLSFSSLLLCLFLFVYGERAHAVVIDGVNDFTAQEELPATTSGYTNWVSWDATYLYLGYYGVDIAANDSSKSVFFYLSTNTNTGSAYGYLAGNKLPVLPFKSDFIFEYNSTGGYRSAFWDGTVWDWSNPLSVAGGDIQSSGNYMEVRIKAVDLGNTPWLDYSVMFCDFTNLYGAVPSNALTDGAGANPSNYISYGTVIWQAGITNNDSNYISYDTVPPYSNQLAAPTNLQKVDWGESLTLSNVSSDLISLTKVEFYTNLGGLFQTVIITNTATVFTINWNTAGLTPGSYSNYTVVYDTFNTVYSATNVVELLTPSELIVNKIVDSVQIDTTNFTVPGALLTYKLTYTNQGGSYATNIVIYDKVPVHTTFYTNYLGAGTSGWQTQYSHVANPDQSYNSVDYDSGATNVLWVRFKKAAIPSGEGGKSMYIGVTID